MQKKKIKPNKIDLVIFDVNQTMFSLNALKVKFKEFRLKIKASKHVDTNPITFHQSHDISGKKNP